MILSIDTSFLHPDLISIDLNDDDFLYDGKSYSYKGIIPPEAIIDIY